MFVIDWLTGPREVEMGTTSTMLRPHTVTATTVFGLLARLDAENASRVAAGTPSDPVVLRQLSTQIEIGRDELMQKHPWELQGLSILGAGASVVLDRYIVLTPGSVYYGQPNPLGTDLRNVIENTGRPRVIVRRLWALAPWASLVYAVTTLVLVLTSRPTMQSTLLAVGGAVVALLLSIIASAFIVRAVGDYRPATIVRPVTWAQVLRTRATAVVALVAAVIGAAATLAAVFVASALP